MVTDRYPLKLAIIGGSGMCDFPELNEVDRVRPETQYGFPSDDIIIAAQNGIKIAFLPRHGTGHTLAPHKVPYKANIAALKSLGCHSIVATCICGSLNQNIKPGDFVVLDQFVDQTWGRDDTVDQDGGQFIHLPMAEPYCNHVRNVVHETAQAMNIPIHSKGTAVVIQGPRFATIAESRLYIKNSWDVINMTQYPECYFARELGLCYGAIAMVTDYDCGLYANLQMDPCQMDQVLPIFQRNVDIGKKLLLEIAGTVLATESTTCGCALTYEEYYKKARS